MSGLEGLVISDKGKCVSVENILPKLRDGCEPHTRIPPMDMFVILFIDGTIRIKGWGWWHHHNKLATGTEESNPMECIL